MFGSDPEVGAAFGDDDVPPSQTKVTDPRQILTPARIKLTPRNIVFITGCLGLCASQLLIWLLIIRQISNSFYLRFWIHFAFNFLIFTSSVPLIICIFLSLKCPQHLAKVGVFHW
jgi:hypothetical protein